MGAGVARRPGMKEVHNGSRNEADPGAAGRGYPDGVCRAPAAGPLTRSLTASGLMSHLQFGLQYTSFSFTAHLIEAGIGASIGTSATPWITR